MVLSKRKAAVAALVCAGLTFAGWGYGQQAIPQTPASRDGATDVVSIAEPGKPPQNYVMQKSFQAANGQTAYELRNVETGEVVTFYGDGDTPPGTKVKTDGSGAGGSKAKSSLVQWLKVKSPNDSQDPIELQPTVNANANRESSSGDAKTQPSLVQWIRSKTSNTNQSPEFAEARYVANPGMDKMQAMPVASPNAAAPTAVTQVRTVEEPGKPPMKCRVMANWRTPEGQKACQMQAIGSGEIMTIVETATGASGTGNTGKVTATLYHWGQSNSPPMGVPLPPLSVYAAAPGQPCPSCGGGGDLVGPPAGSIVAKTDLPKPSFGERLKGTLGSFFLGRSSSTPPAPAAVAYAGKPATPVVRPAEMPKKTEVAKIDETSDDTDLPPVPDSIKVPASPTANDASKMPAAEVTADKASCTDTPKCPDAPRGPGAPKPPDGAQMLDECKAPEAPAPREACGPTDAPRPAEMPKPAATPNSPVTTNAPSAPTLPPDAKKVGGPSAPMLPGIGRPALDAPPTPGTMPSTMAPLPSTPAGLPAAPLPASPAQLLMGGALSLPASPTVPPSGSMLGSQLGNSSRHDPLETPESFAAVKGAENAEALKTIAKAPRAGSAQASDNPRLPLGSASVVAAGGGADPRYLPVPIITMPQTRPPMPPPPQMPQPPNPTQYVNAFTAPLSPEQQQQAMWTAMAMQRQMMPMPGPGPMPLAYQGPMPPNPMGAMPYPPPMMAAGAYPMPMPMQMPMPMPMQSMPQIQPSMVSANRAMDRPGVAVNGAAPVQQCVQTLQSSIFPTQREMAVNQLCNCDWRANPHIVYLLLTTAKADPATMVRVAAISGLARMGVATEAAIATYNQLKADADPCVRLEAEQALARTSTGTDVQPVSGGR